MKKLFFVLLTITALCGSSSAQGVYDDFIYTRQAVQERKVVPWPYLREADVFWAKRIVRVIDVREKQNQCMQWPKNPLSLILYNAVLSGKLIPYTNDSLSSVFTVEEVSRKGADTTYQETPIDPNDPTLTETDTIVTPFDPSERIKKFRIVEDWIFDKKESRMFCRIISIAPQYKEKIAGIDLGWVDLCVLKYHEDQNSEVDCREIFVNMEVFNRQNDAARVTYDDWFEQRLFSSYITKEANQYDNAIKDFAEFSNNGVAALLEAERIKNDLFEREHDLWEF
jgi:gliding motility associated protien GldN